MKPEEKARREIDNQLKKVDWAIQDRSDFNLGAASGIAIREFPTKAGPIDYALFTNRKAIGVVEAKPAGSTLSRVAEQTAKYIHSFPDDIPHISPPCHLPTRALVSKPISGTTEIRILAIIQATAISAKKQNASSVLFLMN